jgi:urease accessory protein
LIALSSNQDLTTEDLSVAAERASKLCRLESVEKPGLDRVAGLAPVEAQLQFAVDAEGRTYLARHYAAYPHHLTRTFRLDRAAPQAATVYLQSLSGGLLQGDHVVLRLSARGGAIAHVTTQAATKVHSMERGFAKQEVNIEALDESHLEYIADPTICFPRSRLFSRTELCVTAGASAILAESYLWHNPRGGGEMAFDVLAMETAIRRPDGHLIALDRSSLTSAHGLSGNPALLGPHRALGTLFAIGRGCGREGALSVVRGALEDIPAVYAGVSRLPAEAGLWARVLASDGASLRAAMESAWRRCHEQMLGWVSDRRRK